MIVQTTSIYFINECPRNGAQTQVWSLIPYEPTIPSNESTIYNVLQLEQKIHDKPFNQIYLIHIYRKVNSDLVISISHKYAALSQIFSFIGWPEDALLGVICLVCQNHTFTMTTFLDCSHRKTNI